MQREELTFDNGRGQTLSGRLEVPPGGAVHFALFAHCFTCSKDSAAASRVSRALARAGIGVLRFDFTGLGNSDGDFANESFSSNVHDLIAAAGALRDRHRAPALLIGHSLGGAAVLAAASEIPEAVGVVTIGAPADPIDVKRLISGPGRVVLAGREFSISQEFLDDLEEHRMSEKIRTLGKALLIFHSPVDDIVGIDEARRIFERALHPKSFVSLDQADHLLSNREDSEYVGATIATWASRYLPKGPAQDVEGVRVETLSGKFTQSVRAGRHRMIADEPTSAGGDDLGPGPYEYLLAGLGACTSMTLQMYAERKGWTLDHVSVELSHDRVHAKDCEDCGEGRDGQIERLFRKIRVEGPLDEEQKQRLLEIANKCPVHKTLTHHPMVKTTLE